jgi:hypothetical protein
MRHKNDNEKQVNRIYTSENTTNCRVPQNIWEAKKNQEMEGYVVQNQDVRDK